MSDFTTIKIQFPIQLVSEINEAAIAATVTSQDIVYRAVREYLDLELMRDDLPNQVGIESHAEIRLLEGEQNILKAIDCLRHTINKTTDKDARKYLFSTLHLLSQASVSLIAATATLD